MSFERLDRAARRAVAHTVEAGARDYVRERQLPRLIPIGPDEMTGEEPATTRRIVARLTRALRGERQRGRAGHWTYDLNKHLGLAQALRAETGRLQAVAPVKSGG